MTEPTPDPPPEPDRPVPSSGADPEKAPEEPAPAPADPDPATPEQGEPAPAAEPAAPPPGTVEPVPAAAAPEPGPGTVEPEPAPATEPAATTAAQHEPEPTPTSPEPAPRAAEPGAAAAAAREPEPAATAVERPYGAAHGARPTRTGPLRLLAILVILGGVILSAAGVITWIVVTDQLSDEKIVVSDDADNFAGEDVDGPFTAYAEAEVIQDHALEASDGLTYAELDQDDPRRETVMTASFLRASLFTSVVAFGVAAFAVGLGILLIIVGWALLRINRSLRATT
jgi:hypothetical protein